MSKFTKVNVAGDGACYFHAVTGFLEMEKLVKDKIEKEWSTDFIDNMNFIIIPRMTIKRRYENKGIDLIKLINDASYYQKVKKYVNSRGSLEFKDS